MSYLDTPRISFFGSFFANPSTINNATENYSLTEVYNTDPPSLANPNSQWWNPQGQAFFRIPGPAGKILPAPSCSVTGAVDECGNPAPDDPVVGAVFADVVHGGPPAQYGRLVDLDPDQQIRSLIVGMRLQISIGGVAVLSGTVSPMTIIDLWGRMNPSQATSGLNVPGSMFQSVMTDLEWGDLSASTVLQQLQNTTQGGWLSFKMNVDNYNGTSGTTTFNYGRVAGTIGPYCAGEPMHFVPQRKMSIFSPLLPSPPASPLYNAPFQVNDTNVTLDLGNSIPMNQNSEGVASAQDVGAVALVIDPAGANISIPVYSKSTDYDGQYAAYAGIFDVSLADNTQAQQAIAGKPVAISVTPNQSVNAATIDGAAAVLKQGLQPSGASDNGPAAGPATLCIAELPSGYYAAVDYYALRLENGQPSWNNTPGAATGAFITGDADIPVWCTQWGAPVAVTLAIQPYVNYYQFPNDEGEWPAINNTPPSAISYPSSVTTDATTGSAIITVTANALSPDQREPRRAAIDGQIFMLYHDYATDCWPPGSANIGPPGPTSPPMNFLVFESSPVIANPTWWPDVYPVLLQYARLYPFMNGLVALSDYATLVKPTYEAKMKAMLSLPMDDPAFMPVTRDLSLLRRQMILDWYANGAPEGTQENES